MRALWVRFGRTGIPVPEDGIERLAAELAGRDLTGFFADFVHGTVELPLERWLGGFGIGMRLRPAKGVKDEGGVAKPEDAPPPARPVLGATFAADPAGARITRVFEGGAAQEAGLSADDVIVAVDGLRVSADNLAERIAEMPAESEIEVHAFRRDELRVHRLRARPAPDDTCDLWLLATDTLTHETRARRERWLGAGGG
jgi:predicted metalloprotease with PDZ domain